MSTYQIESKAGQQMGTWLAESEAEALAAMHRDAGYDVRVEGGAIVWPDAETEQLCGDIDAWHVTEVGPDDALYCDGCGAAVAPADVESGHVCRSCGGRPEGEATTYAEGTTAAWDCASCGIVQEAGSASYDMGCGRWCAECYERDGKAEVSR